MATTASRALNQQWHRRRGYKAFVPPQGGDPVFEMEGDPTEGLSPPGPAPQTDYSPVQALPALSALGMGMGARQPQPQPQFATGFDPKRRSMPTPMARPGGMPSPAGQPASDFLSMSQGLPRFGPEATALMGNGQATGLGRAPEGQLNMAGVGSLNRAAGPQLQVRNGQVPGPSMAALGLGPGSGLSMDALQMMGGTQGYNPQGMSYGGPFEKFANFLGERWGKRRESLGLAGAAPTRTLTPEGDAGPAPKMTQLEFARQQAAAEAPQFVNADGKRMLNDPSTLDARAAAAMEKLGLTPGMPPSPGRETLGGGGVSLPAFDTGYQQQLQMRQQLAQDRGIERGFQRDMRLAGRRSGSGYGPQVAQQMIRQQMANQLGLANRGLDLAQQGQTNEFDLGLGAIGARNREADVREGIGLNEFNLGRERLTTEEKIANERNRTMTDIAQTTADTTLAGKRIDNAPRPVDPRQQGVEMLGVIVQLMKEAPGLAQQLLPGAMESLGFKTTPQDQAQQNLLTGTKAAQEKFAGKGPNEIYNAVGPLLDAAPQGMGREQLAAFMAQNGLSQDALQKAGEYKPWYGYDKPNLGGLDHVPDMGGPAYGPGSALMWSMLGEGKGDFDTRTRRQQAIKEWIKSLTQPQQASRSQWGKY